MKKNIAKIALASLMIAPLMGLLPSAATAAVWDATGSYVINMNYLGTDYPHDMILTQDNAGNLTGSGGSPAGANTYTWVINSGTVSGDSINFSANYTATADAVTPQTVLMISGTIAPDGTMSGTWSDNYQGGNRSGTWTTVSGAAQAVTVQVTIVKFIDGDMATAASANNADFRMTATWDAQNIGSGTGTYDLSETNPTPYQAVTVPLSNGADYATSEIVTDNNVVADTCAEGKPFELIGYSTGNTLAEAQAATVTETAPAFTDLTGDKTVIVWNRTCPTTGHIVVDKVTDPSADPQSFDFTTGGTGYAGFSLTDAAAPNDQELDPGTYTVAETALAGWTLGSVVCMDGQQAVGTPMANGMEITIAAGQTVTCTFTNTKNLKVHILKYLDGVVATAAAANNYQFPMTSSWSAANIGSGSGGYVLGNNAGGAPDMYGAETAWMSAPADYATAETTGGNSQVVASANECVPGKFLLNGYRTSTISFADAATQPLSSAAPAFTGITADRYVIVDNSTCPTKGDLIVEKQALGGNSTFSFTGDMGSFQLTTSGGSASQTFADLEPGTYQINETPQPGWVMVSNGCMNAVVTAGATTTCVIVNTKTGAISGTKYEDRNGNGRRNSGDSGLSGWTIYLDANDNGTLDSGEVSTVTDGNGNYAFSDLLADTYYVREVGMSGWTQTHPAAGKHTVVLAPGATVTKKDFGNFRLGTISGMKYNDANSNGRKDANEAGLAGWTIVLRKPGSGEPSVSTVTDANGNYSFTGLTAGVYLLSEVKQPGWIQIQHPGSVRIASGTNATQKNFGNRLR